MASCSTGGAAASFAALGVVRGGFRFRKDQGGAGGPGSAIISVAGCLGLVSSCSRCCHGLLDGGGFGCSCSVVELDHR